MRESATLRLIPGIAAIPPSPATRASLPATARVAGTNTNQERNVTRARESATGDAEPNRPRGGDRFPFIATRSRKRSAPRNTHRSVGRKLAHVYAASLAGLVVGWLANRTQEPNR